MYDLTRAMLNDLLPPGPIWEPEEQAEFDLLLEGVADNLEVIRAFLSTLSDTRNPNDTIILSDLEREYGVPTNTLLSEDTRRVRLAELVFGANRNGTEDDLQTALRNVGFDVFVYQNDPAVDPAIFLEQQFQMVADGDNAFAGRSDAFAGFIGGNLLVNGDTFLTEKTFTSISGSGFFAGTGHGAGEYENLLVEKQEYPIPTDPNDWPLVFFVGGVETRGFVELQENGGFETGDFTGWDQINSVIDAVTFHSGAFSSRLVATGSALNGARKDHIINTAFTYKVRGYGRVGSYVAGTYSMQVLQFDANLEHIPGTTHAFLSFTGNGGFTLGETTIGPPGSGAALTFAPGAVFLRIQHAWGTGGDGVGWMDDIEFFRIDKQSITAIDNATVEGTREDELKRIILQYKPLHSWAALIISFA